MSQEFNLNNFNALSKREKLKVRADSLQAIRSFFHQKEVIEVDTFLLGSGVIVDEHIDLMRVDKKSKTPRFLLSSPESGMKQLLCQGSGDIFQLAHVYRKEEQGANHSPVFTMLEWYKTGTDFKNFLEDNFAILALFTQKQNHLITSYSDAFKRYARVDCTASHTEFEKVLTRANIDCSNLKNTHLESLVWSMLIEPKLGRSGFEVIVDYPKSQSALAQIHMEKGKEVAKRFEIYFQGKELANGYLELQESCTYKKRMDAQNMNRKNSGKETYPIDLSLIKALKENPLPACYGIAIGFDRLLMLKTGQTHISSVLPLPLQ
ncbi:hypothetical protein COB21_02845 [Candidatus Aerophobetes bacterium]|uniref:Aminoacyl-transfer RNA synthetases class-II family profile domain-containing protein n=1 Tax=Aerophobetes bacterium TaxID=2030807 RepID=A0A2A4X5G5_UNCAE|nr:MAG: hypothetical protein COB21_02845 [Candidatus Aerophobetes bacterium]